MKLDLKNLQRMIDAKYINRQKHPSEDLYIYNYSHGCQYAGAWNNETKQCRGLIMDSNMNVVARPMSKFFGFEQATQLGETFPVEDFVITSKEDGSLATLFQVGGKPYIATRGSFTSDQANKANEILQSKYSHVKFDPKLTYQFEIVYPENQIVLQYNGLTDLILITIIVTKSGTELPYTTVKKFADDNGFPIVKIFDGVADYSKLDVPDNAEGFVVFFPSTGQRLKIKGAEYCRLHRLVTQCNSKTIWELLKDGKSTEELVERVDDMFYDWVKSVISDLTSQYVLTELQARKEFEAISVDGESQKEFALKALKTKHSGILFNMRMNKSYSDQIWKMIKPVAEKPFKATEGVE